MRLRVLAMRARVTYHMRMCLTIITIIMRRRCGGGCFAGRPLGRLGAPEARCAAGNMRRPDALVTCSRRLLQASCFGECGARSLRPSVVVVVAMRAPDLRAHAPCIVDVAVVAASCACLCVGVSCEGVACCVSVCVCVLWSLRVIASAKACVIPSSAAAAACQASATTPSEAHVRRARQACVAAATMSAETLDPGSSVWTER